MSKYVNADKLIEDLNGARLLRKPHLLDYEETIEIIKMSATEIEDVKHGEWVKASDGVYCSTCGEPSTPDDYDTFWEPGYCPNCGANMRGEKK